MVYKFSNKKSSGANTSVAANMPKQKFEKRKLYSSFKGYISGSVLADMQLQSKYHKGFCFLLCIVDWDGWLYAWVVPLGNKRKYYNH